MHGPQNFKFVNAKEEKETYQYRDSKEKLYKTNVAVWYKNGQRYCPKHV